MAEAPSRINSFGTWLQRRFGERVFKVSIDGGFTCPNRDGVAGRGGCTYCNNESFRGAGTGPFRPSQEQIAEGIGFLSRRYGAGKFLVYWQNYTNTYAPVDELRSKFLDSLRADPRIVGITIGTRPDCVEKAKLRMLAGLAERYFVCLEYGLESIFDETLLRVNRGHDHACFRDAVHRTARYQLPVCAHLILGFPWESRDEWLSYAGVVNQLPIDFVKIHHLHVVRGTILAREYALRPFHLPDLEEWIQLVCDFLERLKAEIVVQRLFGWAPAQHLVAPDWGADRAQIRSRIVQELRRRDSWQGKSVGAARPASLPPGYQKLRVSRSGPG